MMPIEGRKDVVCFSGDFCTKRARYKDVAMVERYTRSVRLEDSLKLYSAIIG